MSATVKIRETVARELDKLPDEELMKLLDYIRFLKLKSLPDYEIDARFVSALETARQIARQEGITEGDIREELTLGEEPVKESESERKLPAAAKALLPDYAQGGNLTSFTDLDGEDFHASK